MACEVCRLKKVRCDKLRPTCSYCKAHKTSCTYHGPRRRARRARPTDSHNMIDPSNLSPNSRQSGSSEHGPLYQRSGLPDSPTRTLSSRTLLWEPADGSAGQNELLQTDTSHGSIRSTPNGVLEVTTANLAPPLPRIERRWQGPAQVNETVLDSILSDEGAGAGNFQEDCSNLVQYEEEQEFIGTSSGLSIFSARGLTWIRDRLDDPTSSNALENVVRTFVERLKLPSGAAFSEGKVKPLTPLPAPDVAKDYISAYFDHVQCILPILNRPHFESIFLKFLEDPKSGDASWHCLYNAVLALGCRSRISLESIGSCSTFDKSELEAQRYFRNAMSYQSEILYGRTTFMAVQACTLMTLYSQGIVSPQLEYMLCSVAVRLAIGKGMHKVPHKKWAISEREKEERNRIFWVLYWLDKTIALRSGRPSILDDADINCSFPRDTTIAWKNVDAPAGSDFDFFLCITRYARICSKIIHRLYSATALARHPHRLIETVEALDEEIRNWRNTIPTNLSPLGPLIASQLPCNISLIQALVLHTSYHSAICAIHRRVTFQTFWARRRRTKNPAENQNPEILAALEHSSELCLQAARSMILLTKYIEIDSSTPGWLLFDYPLTALITLFTHVLGDTSSPSVASDIALMEVVTGLFGRLEFYTSGIVSLTNSGEFARLARNAVKIAKDTTQKPNSVSGLKDMVRASAVNVPPVASMTVPNVSVNMDLIPRTEPDVVVEGGPDFSNTIPNPTMNFDENHDIFDSINGTSSGGQIATWGNWDMMATLQDMNEFSMSNDMNLDAIFAFASTNGIPNDINY